MATLADLKAISDRLAAAVNAAVANLGKPNAVDQAALDASVQALTASATALETANATHTP